MNYVHIVALLALAQYLAFGVLAGGARSKYKIAAPAITGNEHFERAYRVQMNTLEQLVGFLPCLLIAGVYWPAPWVAGIGAVYLIGRILYRQAYVNDPAKRGLGFLLTFLPTVVLLLMGLVGVGYRA
jgi:glutathione S-transferase